MGNFGPPLDKKRPPFGEVMKGGVFDGGNTRINECLSVLNDFSYGACIVVGMIDGKCAVIHAGQYLQGAFR